MAGTMSVVMTNTEERAKESPERVSVLDDEDALLLQEDALLALGPEVRLVQGGNTVRAKVIKEKASGSKQSEETKSKQKSKRSLMPFYSTFGFGNRSSKSPDKDKKRKGKIESKSVNYDENEEENEKKDKEKEEEEEREKEVELIKDLNLRSDSELNFDNRLYCKMSCESVEVDDESVEVDDEIPREFIVKKEIKSPKLTSKGISDSKKYSLVKARIAKYQKNTQKDRCSSPDVSNCCKGTILNKSKTLENQSKSAGNNSKYATLDVVRSKFQNHVNNLSYEGVDFAGTLAARDIEYDKQELYDELKLIYDGQEIYAVREHNPEPLYSSDEPTMHRPHLSIDSITLISNKNMKASLNISVSGRPDHVVNALPDTRWKEAGRFSRRSLRKSSHKKNKDGKKKKASSGNSSTSSSPPNELDLSLDSKSCPSGGSTANVIIENINDYKPFAQFPEYAKVNKKKNLPTEALATVDNLCLDYRKTAFKGCSEKGPVAKKIGQSVCKNRRDTEGNIKFGGPVKKTESFKGTKVGRKGSFTYSSRPKLVKRPVSTHQFQQQEGMGNLVTTQALKLRRRDSHSGRNGEYRLSVTIQPSTVASLTDKFNSLISQNQGTSESTGKTQTQIPLGQVSVRDGKLGRVYHSPRASFKRKYRTRSHKNRRSSKMEASERGSDPQDLPITNELEEPADSTSPIELQSPRRTKDPLRVPRIVNIKKVPSIGRAPGDNKTDEEKVYDKIETALSSGKFKGETDESDIDQDDAAAVSCYEEVCRSGGQSANRSDDEASALALPLEGAAESPLQPDCSQSTKSEVLSQAERSSTTDGNETIKREEDSTSKITVEDTIPAKEKSSSVEIFTASVSCTHQKSESIDSGILSDENTTTMVIHKIPETVEEVVYGITGAIDHCSLDTSNSLATCKSEDSGIDVKLAPKITPLSEESDVSITAKEQLENNQTKERGSITFKDFEAVSSGSNNKKTDTSTSIGEEDVSTKEEDSEALVRTVTTEFDKSLKHSRSEDCVSETDNKIYSSILKAVVKNTVRRTKEKDLLKKELDRDIILQEKESWFKRNRSKEREAKSIDRVKCSELEQENDEKSPVSSESKPVVEYDKENKSAANECVTKQKKGKDGKIYESWIFKKLREKSQERKKFKELTPVEVNVEEDDNSKPIDVGKLELVYKTSDKSSRGNIDAKADDSIQDESIETKTTRPSEEKSDGYGLFSFKSRGRNKDKKRTKTTPVKLAENDAAPRKDEHGIVKDSFRDESISSSPASSVRTQHSRKPSDTSVCTVESEKVSGKSSATKLKPTNSQRSTSSIPPPPKTPIPSPPKSARIVLKLNEDELNNDNDEGGKGSAENIYENLYSTDIDKLKKNCVKLEESGIVPNTSFLWSYANPPSVPSATVPSTSDGRTRTPERQTPFIKITGIKSFGRPEKGRRDTSLPRIDQPSDDGHNYSELNQVSSDDSHTTVAYDEIGGCLSAVSYDDVRMSSSCSYDDVRAPSSVGYDSLKAPSSGGGYDPVGPPPARSDSSQYDDCDGAVVTAQLVVVREDQLDSISYLYDDITYNSSQSSNSYEPVNPPGVGGSCAAIGTGGSVPVPAPLSITCIEEVPEPESSPSPQVEGEDEEECGSVHEVFSYKLTRVGPASSAEEATRVPDTAGLVDTMDGRPAATSEEAATLEVLSSSPVSAAAPEPIYGSQEVVYGRTNTTNPEGESVAASSIGLRDSLRSSTSSYHSAYSTKYFTRAKLLDSSRTKEDDRTFTNAAAEQRNNKKFSKSSDDYKESRLGFMGRKFRELGKIGKAKNVDKDVSRKGDTKHADRQSTAPPTKNKLGEKKTKGERERNTEKCSDGTSLASLSEDIYGETTFGIGTVPAFVCQNVTEQVECSTSTKKKLKPNLKLSDCPPLDDDFATTSEVFVTPKETEETFGTLMNCNTFRQGKGELQKFNNAHMILPSSSERNGLPNSKTEERISTLLRHGQEEFDKATQDMNLKRASPSIDTHSSLVTDTLKMMMSEASGVGHKGGTLDEWEDIGDDSAEDDDSWDNDRVPRQLVRVPVRTRRYAALPRVWRKTWSQGVRDITHGSRATATHMRSDVNTGKSSHRAAVTTSNDLDPRSPVAKCEVQCRSVYREQVCYAASPSTGRRHHIDLPRSVSEPAVQRRRCQSSKSGPESREGSCGRLPIGTTRERLCDHHHLVLGRFKSRKNKYRLQEDTKPALEGRYRKRCRE